MVGGIGRRAGPECSTGLQHQVERLGPDAPIGVQQHDDASRKRRRDDLTDRAADGQQDDRNERRDGG